MGWTDFTVAPPWLTGYFLLVMALKQIDLMAIAYRFT